MSPDDTLKNESEKTEDVPNEAIASDDVQQPAESVIAEENQQLDDIEASIAESTPTTAESTDNDTETIAEVEVGNDGIKPNQDDGEDSTNKDSSPLAKLKNKKVVIPIVAVIAIAAIAIFALSSTVFSPQTKANQLYEEGSYAEALEIYETLESSEEIEAKISDCHYWLFVDYLLDNGTYKTHDSAGSYTVEAFSNGDIKCSRNVEGSGYGASVNGQWTIVIHHGETNADFTASNSIQILRATTHETGSGTIDLPSYTYGKEITYDDLQSSGTTAVSSISPNADVVTTMIKTGFQGAINKSVSANTKVTLADLGFTSLS